MTVRESRYHVAIWNLITVNSWVCLTSCHHSECMARSYCSNVTWLNIRNIQLCYVLCTTIRQMFFEACYHVTGDVLVTTCNSKYLRMILWYLTEPFHTRRISKELPKRLTQETALLENCRNIMGSKTIRLQNTCWSSSPLHRRLIRSHITVRSSNTDHIVTKLRDTMMTISGCLKSSQNTWLLVT